VRSLTGIQRASVCGVGLGVEGGRRGSGQVCGYRKGVVELRVTEHDGAVSRTVLYYTVLY